jgi:hypothetical protein
MLVAETSGSYELAPVGVYSAVCVRLINMGMQETSYGLKHQVHLAFEIDEKMEDGRPFLMMQNYTMSLNEKARLRLDLQAWRGRTFSPEELKGFDLKSVLGKPLQVSVVHSADGQYANIGSMMPLGRGMQSLTASGGLIYINSLPEDNSGFELLSEKMKDRVQKGLSVLKAQSAPAPQSFQAPPQVTPAPVAAPAPAPISDFDDEIPF